MDKLNLVLLAGGSSSRFSPLREKNLYKFTGKTLVEIQLSNFIDLQFKSITIITNKSNFEEIRNNAQSKFKDTKVFVQIGDGQSGAVKTALNEIDSGDLLIVNMNDIFDTKLIELFKAKYDSLLKSKHNLLTGYKVDSYFPGGYIEMKGENIVNVVEKPGEGNEPSDKVKLVFDYFSEVNNLKKSLNEVQSEKDDEYEVALANMMKSGEVFELLTYSGNWNTIKYPWHVLNSMQYFLSSIKGQNISKSAKISKGAIINGDVVIEDNVKILDGAIINGPVFIGKNSIIANHTLIRDSNIGEDCIIGGSEVARSYLGSNVELHRNYVGDSILESNISFGAGAITANFRADEKEIAVNVKGVEIASGRKKLGSIIGSDVKIGVGTLLMPGTKIGSNSIIGPGLVIKSDIEDNKYIQLKQEIIEKENNINLKN